MKWASCPLKALIVRSHVKDCPIKAQISRQTIQEESNKAQLLFFSYFCLLLAALQFYFFQVKYQTPPIMSNPYFGC